MELLVQTLLAAVAAFYLTELLRSLAFLRRWRDKKPLACDVCMSFWSALAVILPQAVPPVSLRQLLGPTLLCVLAAAGGALLIHHVRSSALPAPDFEGEEKSWAER